MSTTALILRPNDAPEIHVLECDGPRSIGIVVNNTPRTNLPPMSFEEWSALPEHERNTGFSEVEADYQSACRISRLIANGAYQQYLSAAHIIEIQSRLELLFPGCTYDILRTQPNLRSA